MRRSLLFLFVAAVFFAASPMSATTTCQGVNGPGPMGSGHYECLTSGPTGSSNFTYYGPSQDSMCYLYPSSGLYKSLGVYGSGYGDWSFTSPDYSPYAYFSIMIILDLNNTHNHSGNRFGVLVYDDDNYTVETLGTIDGSGGDICSGQYRFNVYRPGWVPGKHLRLSLQPYFQDSDANSKIGSVSITVYDHQTW